MSIAVLLSGRIVTANCDDTISRLECTFSGYNVTYFVSVNSKVHDSEYMSQFKSRLGIKDSCVNIEHTVCPFDYKMYKKKGETNYENVYSMFYHNKKSFMMMEEYMTKYEMTFDVVLKYRTDVQNMHELVVSELEENTIYVPEGYDYGGLNDNIAYGDIESMKKYTGCVDSIQRLCDTLVIFHPETLLNEYLQTIRLNISRFSFPYVL
jgi:hypothetical protein